MISMGFGKAEFTPEPGLILAGRATASAAEGVQGPLHARVLLADDGTVRTAIVALDLMALPASEVAILRQRLAPISDLAAADIMITCSHTHGAPLAHLAGLQDEPTVIRFLDAMAVQVEAAMRRAVADLRPVQLTTARTTAPGWAFNRRPVYANDEVATHGVTWAEGFVRMETTPDDDLQILVARDESGSVRGGLVSFACHPTVMEMAAVYSSDYAGVLAAELEASLGGIFCFLLGASGDTANPDPADPDQDRYFGWEYARRMGTALAAFARDAIADRPSMPEPRLRVAKHTIAIAQRRPTPEQVALARWYLEESPPDIDETAFMQRLYGHPWTFWEVPPRASERHVRELFGMWEWQRREGTRELIEQVEIQVLAFGECAVVAFPVELFTDFGRQVKAASPFAQTFIATQANGWHGYVPAADAFGRGGYEPFLAHQSRLVPDAGDRMTTTAIDVLQSLRPHTAHESRT